MWAETAVSLLFSSTSRNISQISCADTYIKSKTFTVLSHRLTSPTILPVTPEMALTWPSPPLFHVAFHCCNHHRSGRNMSMIDFFVLNYSTQHNFNVMTPPSDSTIPRASRSCLSTQGQSPAMARPPAGRCLSCRKNPFLEFLSDGHRSIKPTRRLHHSREWNIPSRQLL